MVTWRGQWTTETVGGHPCDIYEPAQRNQHGFTVLYLHGVHVGRLADNEAFTAQFEKHSLPVFVPITNRSWWTDRICPDFDPNITAEQHVLKNVLPFIRQRWEPITPIVGLLGTSMGGQGALRLTYKYPDTFQVVAAISPAIDFHLRLREGDDMLAQMYPDTEAARQDTAILHIHPLHWPRHQFFCCDPADHRWLDSADRLRMKLSSMGIPHECDLETTGGGHGFPYYNVMAERAVTFLRERLEQERLRVR